MAAIRARFADDASVSAVSSFSNASSPTRDRMAWSTSSGAAPKNGPAASVSAATVSRGRARRAAVGDGTLANAAATEKGSGSFSASPDEGSGSDEGSDEGSSFASRLRVRLAASAAGEGPTGPSGGRSSPPLTTPGACPSPLSRPKTHDQDAHASRRFAWRARRRGVALRRSTGSSGGGRRGERRRAPHRRRRRARRDRTRGRGGVRDRARAHGGDGAQRALRGVDRAARGRLVFRFGRGWNVRFRGTRRGDDVARDRGREPYA